MHLHYLSIENTAFLVLRYSSENNLFLWLFCYLRSAWEAASVQLPSIQVGPARNQIHSLQSEIIRHDATKESAKSLVYAVKHAG